MEMLNAFGRRQKYLRSEAGLTLVEVIVAAVILGIIAVGFFTAFDISKRLATAARQQTKAVNLAQGKLEELRGVPYEELKSVPDEAYFDPSVPGFTYRVSVSERTAGAVYKSVTVSVYHKVGKNLKQVTLTMERSGI
ncbi:MAG: prepilin-type N-terminal cleavage/methylation domain-containing protein [Bacillota bacterium]